MSAPAPLTVALESIADSFEGLIPASICTCSPDGTPNVTYLSVVHRVDDRHVGLSHQFFNKTRENMLRNPLMQVMVVSPSNTHQYRLDLRWMRTETEGAVFDRMKIRLDAVASQTGMSQVFTLRGVDICEVLDCRPTNAEGGGEELLRVDYLPQIDEFTARLAGCNRLEEVIDTALDALYVLFGYDHTFLMVPDEDGGRLFTVGSRGFGESGIGSEARMGEGILGMAAECREVVRTTHFSRDVLYSSAVRSAVLRDGQDNLLERRSLCPGWLGWKANSWCPWWLGTGFSAYFASKARVPVGFYQTMNVWCESSRVKWRRLWLCWRAASPPNFKKCRDPRRLCSPRPPQRSSIIRRTTAFLSMTGI